jgi:hypothetical protein
VSLREREEVQEMLRFAVDPMKGRDRPRAVEADQLPQGGCGRIIPDGGSNRKTALVLWEEFQALTFAQVARCYDLEITPVESCDLAQVKPFG